jgi:hypothetical protein
VCSGECIDGLLPSVDRYSDAVNKRLNSIVNPERGFGVDQEK